jgi:hypothetical protein
MIALWNKFAALLLALTVVAIHPAMCAAVMRCETIQSPTTHSCCRQTAPPAKCPHCASYEASSAMLNRAAEARSLTAHELLLTASTPDFESQQTIQNALRVTSAGERCRRLSDLVHMRCQLTT